MVGLHRVLTFLTSVQLPQVPFLTLKVSSACLPKISLMLKHCDFCELWILGLLINDLSNLDFMDYNVLIMVGTCW